MANHGCNNGTLDSSGYSSSAPMVGMYIIVASILCLFLMVFDIVAGFWRTRWLSRKMFSLNSATMVLLSALSMLVVDLTTPMPSVKDQLAKLSGATLICISMGVFVPSIGDSNSEENFWNVYGMISFLVIVIVFIAMQIEVGVISLFIAEHYILIFCMLILLCIMIYCAYDIHRRKEEAIEINKGVFSKSEEGMLKRLKLCYIYGFNSNPQFVICKHPVCATVGGLCLLCTVVLLQATYRSLTSKQIKFCDGTSDYGWSIWPIVMAQIFTVIVGCFITTYRWFSFVNHMKIDWIFKHYGKKSEYVLDMNPQYFFQPNCGKFAKSFSTDSIYILQVVIIFLGVALSKIVAFIVINPIGYCIRKHKPIDNKSIEEFRELIHEGDMGLEKWTVQMGVNDMERWIEASKSESLEFMSSLLMRTPSSRQLNTTEIRDREHPNQVGIEVSSLSMILLARIAEISIPSLDLSPYLLKVFNEAYEIIHFIDSGINSGNFKNIKKLRFAKAVKIGSDFSCLVQKIDFKHSVSADTYQSQNGQMARTVAILEGLKQVFPYGFVRDELCIIMDFINCREHSASVKDLYDHIERIFADMLCALLTQFPQAISKQVLESPAEEYEERVSRALRILCKLQSSFPEGHNLFSWITSPNCSTQVINGTTEEADVAASSNPHIIEVIDTSVRVSTTGL